MSRQRRHLATLHGRVQAAEGGRAGRRYPTRSLDHCNAEGGYRLRNSHSESPRLPSSIVRVEGQTSVTMGERSDAPAQWHEALGMERPIARAGAPRPWPVDGSLFRANIAGGPVGFPRTIDCLRMPQGFQLLTLWCDWWSHTHTQSLAHLMRIE